MPPQQKYFLHEVSDIVSTSVIRQYSDGEQELDAMFGRKGVFANPKPVNLIKRLIGQTCPSTKAVVVDFLAGSGTTAHAVMRGNREEEKERDFIMCEMAHYFDKPYHLKITSLKLQNGALSTFLNSHQK